MSRCPECGIDPGECDCAVGGSSCITVKGGGTVSSPMTFNPILDPDPRNLLSCGGGGLKTETPIDPLFPPAIRRTRPNDSHQTISRGVPTLVAFSSNVFDSDGMSSGNGIRIGVPGVYLLTTNIAWGNSSSNQRNLTQILVDGSPVTQMTSGTPTLPAATTFATAEVALKAGAFVQVMCVYTLGFSSVFILAILGVVPSLTAIWLRELP